MDAKWPRVATRTWTAPADRVQLPAESVNGHADGQVNGHEQEQPATTTTKPVPACDPFIAMSPEDMVAQLTQADKVAFLQQSAQREATVRYAHLVREGGLLTRHHLEFLVKERGGAYTLPDTPHLLAEPVKTELDKWLDEVKAAIIKHLNKDLNKDNDNDMDEDEDDGEDEQKGGDEGGDNGEVCVTCRTLTA